MNKHILKYLILSSIVLLMGACADNEADLLSPKIYFDKKEHHVPVEGGDDKMTLDLTSRVSNMLEQDVEVNYSIGEAELVAAYNAKYGTSYEVFNSNYAQLDTTKTSIKSGFLYADKVKLVLSNLDNVKIGKSYLLPVRLKSNSVPVIPGSDIMYFVLSKPLTIKKVGVFTNHYISVRFPSNTFFKSFTYEALVYATAFNGSSHTIMGTEGVMILRVGDTGGGIARNILQIAGGQHYEAPDPLLANKWYHLALTYDQMTGKTIMYVNGNKWAESAWAIAGFDPNADVGFKIGKLDGFKWGERPFSGYMSEIRVWSVARTENQLKQNMFGVDPKTDGLELYYKLDGSDVTEGRTLRDAAKNLEGKTNRITIKQLDAPVTIE